MSSIRHKDESSRRINTYPAARVIHRGEPFRDSGDSLDLLQAVAISSGFYLINGRWVETEDCDTTAHFVDDISHVQLFMEIDIPRAESALDSICRYFPPVIEGACLLVKVVLMDAVLSQIRNIGYSAQIGIQDDAVCVCGGLTLSRCLRIIRIVLLFPCLRRFRPLRYGIRGVKLGLNKLYLVLRCTVWVKREGTQSRIPVVDEQHVLFIAVYCEVACAGPPCILPMYLLQLSSIAVHLVGNYDSILENRFCRRVKDVFRRMIPRKGWIFYSRANTSEGETSRRSVHFVDVEAELGTFASWLVSQGVNIGVS
mmetsp:Transcript_15609/g.18800  ORF Transcript_15609/g.18800 Transcript_15609/m.18800 type:complete len:312 (-) Transcript_15609:306-1241(-)